MKKKYFVYELWADNECLYVGFTGNLPNRLRDHIANTGYARRVTDIRVTVHATDREALDFEAAQIFELQPTWNTQSKKGRGIGAAASSP